MPELEAADDPHYFDFDLDRGIRDQVVQKLEGSPLLQLARDVGPALSGIYALYFRDDLVYIGKASKGTTTSKRTLRSRLADGTRSFRRDSLDLSFAVIPIAADNPKAVTFPRMVGFFPLV